MNQEYRRSSKELKQFYSISWKNPYFLSAISFDMCNPRNLFVISAYDELEAAGMFRTGSQTALHTVLWL